MLFVIQFRDNPEKRHLRPELLPQHLEYLRGLGDKLRTAGSLRIEADDSAVGGLWVVDVPAFADVRKIYLDDPFWTAGLRQSVEIHRLAKAFPEVSKPV
ncbi:MAG: hypothetical protein JWM88_3183 [Verrucomicrobia bacterium]|nr:hypothetical protein [Verrucomicrobiota bacterium]